MTHISLIRGDITRMVVDAIVNAANNSLLGGGGVDGAIHRAAGPALLEECRALGGCPTGEAKITAGYNLPARYVIHTVGPVWSGEDESVEGLLHNAYHNSLLLAAQYDINTIAFPNISTGVFRFPRRRAAQIALKAVSTFCIANPDELAEIIFVCFDDENYEIYRDLLTSPA